MYVSGAVLAVPVDNKAAYLEMAGLMGEMFVEFGALECTENWEDNVEDGQATDFRQAVKAEAGEKIVFSWIIWPDRKTCDDGHEKMMKDERMQSLPEMPFDGKRMIFGGFDQIYRLAR